MSLWVNRGFGHSEQEHFDDNTDFTLGEMVVKGEDVSFTKAEKREYYHKASLADTEQELFSLGFSKYKPSPEKAGVAIFSNPKGDRVIFRENQVIKRDISPFLE